MNLGTKTKKKLLTALLLLSIPLVWAGGTSAVKLVFSNEDAEQVDDAFILDIDNQANNIDLQFGQDLTSRIRFNRISGNFEINQNIDLEGNQLINTRIENLASAPTCDGSTIGRIYFDTTSSNPFVCDGTSWVDTTGILDVVDDTTPQLGGDLDVNGNSIISAVGNLLFDNTNATGATQIQLGTDTDATDFQVLNDSGDVLFEIDGTGQIQITPEETNQPVSIGAWNNVNNTDIDALIGTTNSGSLFESPLGAHMTFGIRENTGADLISFISGGGNYASDSTYDTVIMNMGPSGNVTLPSGEMRAFGGAVLGDGDDSVSINSSTWDITSGGIATGLTFDANGTGNSITNIDNADLSDDTIDFDKIADALTLDATTTVDMDTNGVDLNFDSDTLVIDSSANSVGIGVAAPNQELEIAGDLAVGAGTETIADAGFVLDGDDAFIAGTLGVEGGIYTDDTQTKTFLLGLNEAIRGSAATGTVGGGNSPVIRFDDGNNSQARWSFPVPDDWQAGTDIIVNVFWSAADNTAGDINFDLLYSSYGVGDTIAGGDFTDAIGGVTAVALNSQLELQQQDATLSAANINADEMVNIRLRRDPTNGDDTYAEDANIHMVRISYTGKKLR